MTGLRRYEQLAEQVIAMRDGLTSVRATEYSADGLITAVVGGRGELLELELDPRVYRELATDALAESIMDTVRAAMAVAEREAVQIAKKLVPDAADPIFDPALQVLETNRRWR
jgi:DNA-binding protein YbaB